MGKVLLELAGLLIFDYKSVETSIKPKNLEVASIVVTPVVSAERY